MMNNHRTTMYDMNWPELKQHYDSLLPLAAELRDEYELVLQGNQTLSSTARAELVAKVRAHYDAVVEGINPFAWITEKVRSHDELDVPELKILYNIEGDFPAEEFKKYNIPYLRKSRDMLNDFKKIFQCTDNEVAMHARQMTAETKLLWNSIDVSKSKKVPSEQLLCVIENFRHTDELSLDYEVRFIGGNATISGDAPKKLRHVGGNLAVNREGMGSTIDVSTVHYVGNDVSIWNIEHLDALVLPKYVVGNVVLHDLVDVFALYPGHIGGRVILPDMSAGDILYMQEMYPHVRFELKEEDIF